MLISDHTHVLAKTGDILTIRGFQQNGVYIAVPIYFKSPSGNREYKDFKFKKFVDEFTDRYAIQYPALVRTSVYGRQVVLRPEDMIECFAPFEALERVYDKLSSVERACIDSLTMYVPVEDIGIIGSRLVGFSHDETDLDVIVRGKDNLCLMRKMMPSFVRRIGAAVTIAREQIRKSVVKYENLFNAKYNSFDHMIANRWPTIHIPGKLFAKLRFTYKFGIDKIPAVPEIGLDPFTQNVKGTVIDSVETALMPRRFFMRVGDDITWQIITYFWDYSYCVTEGDVVAVRGFVDVSSKTIVISSRENHGLSIKHMANPTCTTV